MSNTRERILDHALERFNEAGVESVGIRDLARELGLSPGNVSYHFPKKDDLVAALAQRLSSRNEEIIGTAPADLTELLEMYRAIFESHRTYRFMFRSLVHLLEDNEQLAGDYPLGDRRRRGQFAERLRSMCGAGGLKAETSDDEIATIVAHITLIGRSWVVEKRLSFPEASPEAAYGHYLRLMADILVRHSTPAGRQMLRPYLEAELLTL